MLHDITPADSNYVILLAYYKLTEGAGRSILADSSSTHATSQLLGFPIWRQQRGADLYTNFSISSSRLNVELCRATAAPILKDTLLYDTIIDPAHAIIDYSIAHNDSVKTLPMPTYKWLASKTYTHDETGRIVDSSIVRAQDTKSPDQSQLRYFQEISTEIRDHVVCDAVWYRT